MYNFHDLKGKQKGEYSMDIDGRKSSFRLIVRIESFDNEEVFSNSISIESIEIKEASKHYE